jgi:hypothetical protein
MIRFRFISMLIALPLLLGLSPLHAQTKKAATVPGKIPTAQEKSISVSVYLRDQSKNAILLETRIWPDHPDYNARVLQRFFAMMKMLEPTYVQDNEVAYTWANKERVAKCGIYLESAEAGLKTGTGAVVGCEANGVSNVRVSSAGDATKPSASEDPKHLNDVMELFKKQSDRAKNTIAKQ